VLLGAIAASTTRIRLQTGVTVLSLLDPVRAAEDYATVDQLSRGRLEIVIGKGNEARHFPLFGLNPDDQWDLLAEKYELLRRLWREEKVSWSGRFRPPLEDATSRGRTTGC
jgi:alkanesulfonate monooxygenase SsuD/methylene tetrahydromethanopterin reductase-like flavin-dependent oxidoreductase (luciferase family)